MTLAENVSELHEFLFDEENYEVSATVAEYSADIERLSNLTEKSRESRVLELLQANNDSLLKIPSQPAYIIQIPEE